MSVWQLADLIIADVTFAWSIFTLVDSMHLQQTPSQRLARNLLVVLIGLTAAGRMATLLPSFLAHPVLDTGSSAGRQTMFLGLLCLVMLAASSRPR